MSVVTTEALARDALNAVIAERDHALMQLNASRENYQLLLQRNKALEAEARQANERHATADAQRVVAERERDARAHEVLELRDQVAELCRKLEVRP
jgi:predicted nuclease with TOPRIM domain